MKKALFLVMAVAAAALSFYGGELLPSRGGMVKKTRFLMDTICVIQAPSEGLGRRGTEAAIERAFDRMAGLDAKLNVHRPGSEGYLFNNERRPISDPEIYSLVEKGLAVSRETGGAFDMTAYPLTELWGFYDYGSSTQTVPSDAAVKKALSKVGWRRIALRQGKVFPEDGEVKLDLGGIAKGYILGAAVRSLKDSGVPSALIIAGGQVQAFGTAAKDRPWRVGVRNPRREGYMASLEFSEETGIATSGDYERFFEEKGVRYHHILDPRTGRPARGLMSASVLMGDPLMADALSTAFFVMGRERSAEYARRRGGVDYILVDEKGAIFNSGDAASSKNKGTEH